MSDVTRTYALYHTFMSRWVTLAGAGFFLVAAIAVFAEVASGSAPVIIAVIGLLFLIFAGFAAFWGLRIPTAIAWHGDGTISFSSPVRTVRVSVSEIESIRPWSTSLGFLELRHSGRRLHLLNQFDGFHDFLSRLRQAKPSILIRGC